MITLFFTLQPQQQWFGMGRALKYIRNGHIFLENLFILLILAVPVYKYRRANLRMNLSSHGQGLNNYMV